SDTPQHNRLSSTHKLLTFSLPPLASSGRSAPHSFIIMQSNAYLESIFSLSGKVAVVIGGTGELCGAMAEGLAGAGAEVVLVGRNAEKAEQRLKRITEAGGRGYFVAAEAGNRK